MTTQQKIIRNRLGVLELAQHDLDKWIGVLT